jgi:ABC-type phosphate transport system substrate-binding protein
MRPRVIARLTGALTLTAPVLVIAGCANGDSTSPTTDDGGYVNGVGNSGSASGSSVTSGGSSGNGGSERYRCDRWGRQRHG